MDRFLPFKAEYSKSSRATTCHVCHEFIEKDSLKVGKQVRSLHYDGLNNNWYHVDCIFSIPQKPTCLALIANLDNIKWDDQQLLKQKIARRHSEPSKDTQQIVDPREILKRKRTEDLSKFIIEYAKSDDIICFCEDPIEKGEIQVCKKEEDTGLFEEWHHLRCFADLRDDFEFISSGSCLPGFDNLNKKDQAIVSEKLPPIDDENLPPTAKRASLNILKTAEMNDVDILMMMQNEKFLNMKNKLETHNVSREDMIAMLTHNDQRYVYRSFEDLKDALADRLAFGSVSKCQKCLGRRKFISGYGYVCCDCENISINPTKSDFKILLKFKRKYEFLKFYQSNVETRLLCATAPKNVSLDMLEFEQSNNSNQVLDYDELRNIDLVWHKEIVIDPEVDLLEIAQAYQSNGAKYAVTLGFTDIKAGYNSFYKLRILQYHHQDKYALFRSWGRIGTQIGSSKIEVMPLDTCIQQFEILFFQKTGNMWIDRHQFTKYPYKMNLMDIEEHAELNRLTNITVELKSKLQPKIQDLMNLIFNLNNMENLMTNFRLDVNKMPLGKLSRTQIEKAFEVLQEIQNFVTYMFDHAVLLEASNRFYTLIPHSFGASVPPVIDNDIMIRQKRDMLTALMNIEFTYQLTNRKADSNLHPLDNHYEQLDTEIDILDSDSKEYKMIEKYVRNTHGHSHSKYSLQIENIFTIERHGEAQRYQRFEKLHNKKLLWHGSRTSNFAGILSQGLKIAPPNAIASGQMFGKGIYFADMVSKSANYCFADNSNPTGLLLLCEVALGNMYNKLGACENLRLPKNKHSTFGRGRTFPNPWESHQLPNGTEVPCGTSVYDITRTDLKLLYNEYIVYNPTQIKTRYLVQVKFDFK